MGEVPAVRPAVGELGADDFRARIAELIAVYLAAMRYPEDIAGARARLWAEHAGRPGFRCVVALDGDGAVAGLGYGYHGVAGQWWHTQVRHGLGDTAQQWMSDYFELTELHVRPDRQGAGVGEELARTLLSARPEALVLLSTPEGENRAWRLYRRLGFLDVLRDYRFDGDSRPFAVLGRSLPLPQPTQ